MNDGCAINGPCPNHPNNAWAQKNGIDTDLRLLAAIAYAEAYPKFNNFMEMYGIASVTERQRKAWGYSTIEQFLKAHTSFSSAYKNQTPRFTLLYYQATIEQILKDDAMNTALAAAKNARAGGVDYSNGANFWDGEDLETNRNHTKVKAGIHYTDRAHAFYDVPEIRNPQTTYWYDEHGQPTKVRGTYDYTYDSTAFYGRTIFWKYCDAFLKATGAKPWSL